MEWIKRGEEDKENVNLVRSVEQSTPIAEVRRSSKITRPPQR